jgi:hypothetical protein
VRVKFQLGLLAAIAGVSLLLYQFPPQNVSVKLVGNGLQVLGNGIGIWYVSQAFRAFGREDRVRVGWLLLSLSLVANTLGFAFFGALELMGASDPFPSVADVFWLFYYPLQLVGIVVLSREYKRSGLSLPAGRGAWLAGATAALLACIFLVVPYVRDDSLTGLNKTLLVLYPLGDAVSIGGAWFMASLMRPFGRGALTWPWWSMVSGTVLFAVSDSGYALMALHDLYHTGMFIDLGWVFGGLFMALGGWLQHRIMTYDLTAGGGLR